MSDSSASSLTMVNDLRDRVPRPSRASPARLDEYAPGDTVEVGGLYYTAYDPPAGWPSRTEALRDIRAWLRGDYGECHQRASFTARHGGTVVGAILTVHRAPWDDTPPGPFIVELFVDRQWRRFGIARQLLSATVRVARDAGHDALGLRVAPDNDAALELYRATGFVPWQRTEANQ